MKTLAILIGVLVGAAAVASALAFHHRYQIVQIRAVESVAGTADTSPRDPNDPSLHQTVVLDTLTGRTWLLESRPMKDNPAVFEEAWEPLGYRQADLPQRGEQREPY